MYNLKSNKPVRAAVLGSTGSVGTQALDALSHMGCRVVMLAGGRNTELLAEQARLFKPEICTVEDRESAEKLRAALAGENVKVYGGKNAVEEAVASCGADVIFHAIAGLPGLPSALAAAKTGARIGMANKEAIIAAGDLIFEALSASGGELIPVDSEHSAIFQCLAENRALSLSGKADPSVIKRILLTASGGPFYGRTRDELSGVTPEEALRHPTWKMGPKITIDSATLMNKGFEVIEAWRLFGVPYEKIEVLIHRQSIIHSMVEYIDNTVIAQLGLPDMRACVRYALTCPHRADVEESGIDFTKVRNLTFDQPDAEAFPLLFSAKEVIARAGIVPTALIAADEEAVAAFIKGQISFNQISDLVFETIHQTPDAPVRDIADVYAAEKEARIRASEILKKYR